MHQRVAAINDLSGLGRCSLTVDIAVLAAMGIEACPLPTAVLTAQTGYPGYRCVPFTKQMYSYTEHWQELQVLPLLPSRRSASWLSRQIS